MWEVKLILVGKFLDSEGALSGQGRAAGCCTMDTLPCPPDVSLRARRGKSPFLEWRRG